MQNFRNTIEFCGLHDLSFLGYEYTWDNRKDATVNIQALLDPFFRNVKALDLLSMMQVTHLTASKSNHLLLLLESFQANQMSGQG
jgi:hypothetical protein